MAHLLRIGKQRIEVKDLADASRAFQIMRQEHLDSGKRGADMPQGRIDINGAPYFISFNGRVWAGKGSHGWKESDKPVLEAVEI